MRRGKYMKLCVKCANNVKIAQRIYGREHWRRQRAKFLAEQEALKAPLLARLGELLELRKLDLEEMVWHVEHEITPTSHMKFRGAPDHDSFPSLPARPLWLKINRMIAEERGSIYAVVPKFTNAKGKPIVDNARRVVCLRLNVSERAYSNWQKEAATVAFDIADDVLRYAGWNWFDVWDPDDYPEVEAIFESEELTVMAA